MNLHAVMQDYAIRYGLEWREIQDRPVNVDRAKQIARTYQGAIHNPYRADLRVSYTHLAHELQRQLAWLYSHGLQIERWDGSGEPYENSRAMLADLQTGHLFYLPTDAAGDLPSNHPMSWPTRYGIPLNDLFRAVHDAIGHGVYGWSFGPRGEDNAFRTHKATLTPYCHLALACETRAQNSWFNYGPYAKLPVQNRPFAPQKCVALPDAWLED